MSLLQIKKLEAPLDLRRDSINTAETSTNTATGNANYKPTDEGVFTCHFNRTIDAATDFPPLPTGGTGSINITVSIFDENAVPIDENIILNATQANIRTNNHICFKLSMSDGDFQCFGGGSIYVHVVINNPNSIDEDHVQFRVTCSENYHETIKHIHIYDEKKVDRVYWSTQQAFPTAGGQDPVRENITLSEDAFIHVWTCGLWGKNVMINIYERSLENRALVHIVAPMGRNRKVLVVSMKYLVACYCNEMNITYSENDLIDLNFYIKTGSVPSERIDEPPLAASPSSPVEDVNNPPENEPLQADTFCKESGDLHLEASMDDKALSTVNNGNVFLQVNKGEAGIVEPDRYRDFLIGYMCHIEGVGSLVNSNTKSPHNTSSGVAVQYTLYPFNVYEIMLSDLVACGLVTLDEAAYLTTQNHDKVNLEEATDLQNNFDKLTANLSSSKTLISIFRDSTNSNYAKSVSIRKVLTQVKHKETSFPDETNICRDAWQLVSSKGVIQDRRGPQINNTNNYDLPQRYDTSMECPFGDFFLNFEDPNQTNPPTYEVYVSRNPSGRNTGIYNAVDNVRPESPNRVDRGGIALHKGGSNCSTGCITFNLRYSGKNLTGFNDLIYPSSVNHEHLNFLCIDERNAVKLANNDPQTVNKTSVDFHRYYDLIEPEQYQP